MPRRFCLLVLIGLPGSGKTTFVRAFRDHLAKEEEGKHLAKLLHVCYDEITSLEKQSGFADRARTKRDDQEGGKDEDTWGEARRGIVNAVAAILSGKDEGLTSEVERKTLQMLEAQMALTALAGGDGEIIVVIDDNNYYRSMRYEYHQLARTYQSGFCQLFFPVPLEDAVAQNCKRVERVPDEVIRSMQEKLEPPDPLRNPWEQFSFSVSPITGSDLSQNFEMYYKVITLAMAHPVLPLPDDAEAAAAREKSRVICSANVIHQSDKMVRKMIGKIMSGTSHSITKEESESKIKLLNEARLELLEDLRTGFTPLPAEAVKGAQEGSKESGNDGLEKVIQELFDLKLAKDNNKT